MSAPLTIRPHGAPESEPRKRRQARRVKITMPVLSATKRATIATALRYGAKLEAELNGFMLIVTLKEDR